MALNKTLLKSDIKTMLNGLKNETDQEAAIEQMAASLSDAIDDYVKTATVTGVDSTGGPINGTLV